MAGYDYLYKGFSEGYCLGFVSQENNSYNLGAEVLTPNSAISLHL